jgi:hypothetical protein
VKHKTFLLASVLLASAVFLRWNLAQQSAEPDQPDANFKPVTVIKRAFPPIVDARSIRADQVAEQVRDNELVLGVVVGGKARAYPINMLTGPRREIINDTLGGRVIAATW